MKEEWRDIPNYEGYYEVSSFGRVKSLRRVITNINGINNIIQERILKPHKNKNGYRLVILSKHNIKNRFNISVLVAIVFHGHIPCGYLRVVDHIDNKRLDDYSDNLQIITNRKNSTKDIDKTKTTSNRIGVYWNKKNKKYMSRIYIDGKRIYLGSFDNEDEAGEAYQKALRNIDS